MAKNHKYCDLSPFPLSKLKKNGLNRFFDPDFDRDRPKKFKKNFIFTKIFCQNRFLGPITIGNSHFKSK